MDSINKKISSIEKTLNKMKKEISTITTNTDKRNSIINFKNSRHLKKNNTSKNIVPNYSFKNKKVNSIKHYFQLNEKDKKEYVYMKNNKIQKPHSLKINYSSRNMNKKIKYKIHDIENEKNNSKLLHNNSIHSINPIQKMNGTSLLNERTNKYSISNTMFDIDRKINDFNQYGNSLSKTDISYILDNNDVHTIERNINHLNFDFQNLENANSKLLKKKIKLKSKINDFKNKKYYIFNKSLSNKNDDKKYIDYRNNYEQNKLFNKKITNDYNSIENKRNEYFRINEYCKNNINNFNNNNKIYNTNQLFINNNKKSNCDSHKSFNYNKKCEFNLDTIDDQENQNIEEKYFQMVVLEEVKINQNVILKVVLYLKKAIKRVELIIIYQNRTI